MDHKLMTQLAEGAVVADPGKFEVMYRVPGKGGWKVKSFKNQKAAQAWAEKQDSDVEMQWPSGMQADESAPVRGDPTWLRLVEDLTQLYKSKKLILSDAEEHALIVTITALSANWAGARPPGWKPVKS